MPSNSEMPILNRRDLLRMAVAGGVALGARHHGRRDRARRADAQTALTPDEALKTLMDGNARFTAGRLTSFQEDLTLLAQKTAEKQEPFAAVLSCADSRVPVEILFDQTIGHVFVVRVAGNVATPGDHREPRIRSRRPRYPGPHGAGPRRVRGGDGGDRGEGGPGTDQRALRASPPRREPGGPRSRRRRSGRTPASRRASSAPPRR